MKQLAWLTVAVVIVAAAAGVAVGDTATLSVDDDHDLADDDAIQEFQADGAASADLSQIDMTVTVAEDKTDAGMSAGLTPLDARNDYLRLEHNEGVERTVRIYIPAEMATPYTREAVDGLTSSHTAEYEPVRSGEYLSVTVHFGGEEGVVLPIDRSASATYDIIDRAEQRVERLTGVSLQGDDEWTYVSGDEMDDHTVLELDANPETAAFQYDAGSGDGSELWVTMPEGDTRGVDVYWYYSAENDRIYVVPKGEHPPTIRYKEEATIRDRADGALGDARENIKQIRDSIEWPPWGDD